MDRTTEYTKWFFDQPPPRQVDETLLEDALNVVFPKLVRRILYVLPALVLVTMVLAIAIMLRTGDFRGEWRLMTEPTVLASGKVLDVEKRKGSKGSISYVYTFELRPADGDADDPPVKSICFSGSEVASAGQTVLIEYIPDNPKISRIQGCRLNPIPLIVVVAMPFLGAIPVLLPIVMIRLKRKWLQRLLAFGVTTSAMIEKVKPGPKGSLVVGLRYEVGGTEIKSKTNVGGRKQDKERISSLHESARPMMVLVDPRKPKSVFILDLLPSAKEESPR